MMQLLCHPRATPLVVVSYQDGMFVIRDLITEEGVICLTPDTVADVVKEVCKNAYRSNRAVKKHSK